MEGCTGRPHWGDMGGIQQVTPCLEKFMTSSTVEILHTNWPPQGFKKEQLKRPGFGKWNARTHGVISPARQCIPQAATLAAACHTLSGLTTKPTPLCKWRSQLWLPSSHTSKHSTSALASGWRGTK